jgi:hypothetical protein
MFPTILPRRYAHAANMQAPYLALSGRQLLSQGGPGVRLARHRRRRQALRRNQCTARRSGGCDKHCDDYDAQLGRFSHGRRGRDVRYARTIINAHHVSYARMQSPCARLARSFSRLVLALRASCTPVYCPGATRGDRGVRYARTIANAHWQDFWRTATPVGATDDVVSLARSHYIVEYPCTS